MKVDVDEFPEVANRYDVQSVPTLVHRSKTLIGAKTLTQVTDWISATAHDS